MSTYLLTCTCGNSVSVEVGQAGGKVACSCGTQLEVPPLRQLRHLPQAKPKETAAARTWGTRQGWITLGLIVVGALLVASAWTWWTQPVRPKFVAEDYMANNVDRNMKAWKPIDAWNLWIEYYRPLAERGIPVFEAHDAAQREVRIAHAEFLRGMLLVCALVFAAITAAIAFWPKAQR
jgi:hypothetical protein